MFKKVATLQFKKIYASDNNKDYYWRDFVKQANDKLATDSNFVPKNFYEYNTDKFLYLTARAISSLESWGPNGNFDAFPWEELKKSYPTFCGKGFYIEHKEDDENDAKGIILDAQPDEDNEFINCICAISKEEYPQICDDILNGRLNQVSMSCLAAECECSRCHNIATKEEELCEHMNPEHPHFCKGSLDSNGKPIYEINRDIVFTGLSGVAVPADKDAFIFDVKASKKSKTSIDKEYNKYLRAKKEYEYINKVLENKDLCKYIISKLEAEQKIQKKAEDINHTKEINNTIEEVKKYYQELKQKSKDELINMIPTPFGDEDKKYFKTKDDEYLIEKILRDKYNYPYYINISKEINSKLKKKADVEYFSDKVQEVPEIDFYTEFMNAGKSKGNSEEINKEQLEMGKKVEMEHTTNPIIAEKIAMDHIKEIPNYYNLLAEMEASAKANYDAAKQEINKETNEEYPTKLASKQFFKIKKASWEVKKDKDNKYHILTPDGKYKNSKGEIYKFDTEKDALEEMEYLKAEHKYENKKQASKQFFKIKKASKKWFKIANNIDNYGLSQLQRETISDIIFNIGIVNENDYVTWEELIESVPTDIISYDFMNKNKDKIVNFIQNELNTNIE